MELNTEIWGNPTITNEKFYRTPNGTLNQMVQNGIIDMNEEIDQSIYWCTAFKSKLSVGYWALATRNNDEVLTIPDHNTTPQRDISFMLYYNGMGSSSFQHTIYGKNGLGYDIENISSVPSHITPIVKYARAYLIFLCYVWYVEVSYYDDQLDKYIVTSLPQRKTLYEWEHMEHDMLRVVGISFQPYTGTQLNSRSQSNAVTVIDSTAVQSVFKAVPSITDHTIATGGYAPKNYDSYYGLQHVMSFQNTFCLGGYTDILTGGNAFFGKGVTVPYYFPHTVASLAPVVIRVNGESGDRLCTWLSDNTLVRQLFHLFAETGLYYCSKQETATSALLGPDCTDDDVFIGEVIDGNATGRHGSGGETPELNPDTTGDTDPDTPPIYNGKDDTDPNPYDKETPLPTPKISPVNVFNRSFAMSYNNIMDLSDYLWNADDDVFEEIVKGLGLMGESPIDALIDLRLYPFNVLNMIGNTGTQDIVVGRTNTGVQGVKLTNDITAIIDLGECTFFKKHKNFLDYEPYTEGRLYIPYCGIVPISTSEFMGHTITAKLIVDIVTGACVGVVFRDGIACIYANGVCGVSIPMSATNSAAFAQSVTTGVIGSVGELIGSVKDMASGNVGKAISGAISGGAGLYDSFSTPVKYASAGGSSPSCANWEPQYAYFIVDFPIENAPDDYGHCVGFACEEYKTLSSFSGYTVVSNPDLTGISATREELDEIKRLLQEGVYI